MIQFPPTSLTPLTPAALAEDAADASHPPANDAAPHAPPADTAVTANPMTKFDALFGAPAPLQAFYADANGAGGGGASTQRATGAGGAQSAAARERHLDELARDPGAAHREWKKLSPSERDTVVEKMRGRFGEAFAKEFADIARKGKAQPGMHHYANGVGPSKEDLAKAGYKQGGMLRTGNAGLEVEVWVHPSGKRVHRDVSTHTWGGTGAPAGTGGGGETRGKGTEGPASKYPPNIDPHDDRDKRFGKVIAIKEDVDAAFGRGDMLLYEDGTLELFVEGEGGKSYVFVPMEGGRYAVYGQDGRRLNDKAWEIPAADIPDPVADAVDDD